MKEKLLCLILISCLAAPSLCFGEGSIELFADPEAIFIRQNASVKFTLKAPENLHNPQVTLMRVQSDGKEKAIGNMRDDGKEGDNKAEDLIFSYTIKATPEKVEILRFKGIIKAQKPTGKITSKEIKIEVIECPE